jgi:two-component system sensor histidine kinase TctE
VRVAVLLQPVAGQIGQGMATIQVAETLELRRTLARQVLVDTLWRQAALLAVIAAVVWAVVQQATRPVRQLSDAIESRAADDLSPIEAPQAPRELAPLIAATNHALQRQTVAGAPAALRAGRLAPTAHAAGGAEGAGAVGPAG